VSTLLTIVLMGLLAGLLGVAVWTARGAAERTVCTMHLRQVANALIMYRTECGDYPPGYSEVRDSDGGIEIVTWEQALSSYLGKRQNLLECPAVARRDEPSGLTSSPSYEYARTKYSESDRRGPLRRLPGPRAVLVDAKEAAECGALLVCLHHDKTVPSYKRWTLVAYEDGSVKWERAPSFLKPNPPPDRPRWPGHFRRR